MCVYVSVYVHRMYHRKTYLRRVDSAYVRRVPQQCDPKVNRDVVSGGDLVRAWALGEQVARSHPRVLLVAPL